MNPVKRIFIIGHPGAGKALLGKTLAEKIGWKFIDADFGLEIHVGRSLPEIVGEIGGKNFHQSESAILTALLRQENIVISTDSAIVCHEQNRKILSAEFAVYLKVDTSVQLERTLRNPQPLLPDTDLKVFFDKLHQERDILYEQVAAVTIDGNDSALDEHVSFIVKKLALKEDKKLMDSLPLDKKDYIFYHKTTYTPVHLTEQQALCLKLLAQGKSSKEMARIMDISYRTVEGYIAKVAEILGCSSSKELIALYHDKP